MISSFMKHGEIFVPVNESRFWCYDDDEPRSKAEMVEEALKLADLYYGRPLGRNVGGMGFARSFYL